MKLITLHGEWLLGQVDRLRKLTVRPGSGMERLLNHLEVYPKYASVIRAAVAVEGKTDLGMGLLCPEWAYGLMVSVRKESRRTGIGSDIVLKLLPYAEGWHSPPLVWTGTAGAEAFWKNFESKVRVE